MRYLVIIAFLSFAHSVLASESLKVAADGRVILNSGEWMPTPEQAQRALARIHAFLQKPGVSDERDKKMISAILANKAGYRVQFFGTRRDGKQIVTCNFFPAHNPSERDLFSDWKDRQVVVDDGGFYFWQIEYDPAADKCGHFQANGDA